MLGKTDNILYLKPLLQVLQVDYDTPLSEIKKKFRRVSSNQSACQAILYKKEKHWKNTGKVREICQWQKMGTMQLQVDVCLKEHVGHCDHQTGDFVILFIY